MSTPKATKVTTYMTIDRDGQEVDVTVHGSWYSTRPFDDVEVETAITAAGEEVDLTKDETSRASEQLFDALNSLSFDDADPPQRLLAGD